MSFQRETIDSFNSLLKKNKTLVFYVEIDQLWDDDYQFEIALRLLPFSQQTKIIQKKFPKDAKTALANQLLQRFISCLCLGITDGSKLEFKQNQYGKPYLVGSIFSYSMSNQQGYTSMVISYQSEEVGIDLASISDIEKFGNGYLTHFKDIFHPDEYEFLQSVQDDKELECLFTEYWALKESYTKKLGIGLNGELGAYNFQNVAKLSKPTINSIDSNSFDSISFDLKPNSHWSDSTKLFINNTHIQPLDIHLTMLNNDIVLSVCGDQIPNTPSLIKIPLSLITKFFS